MRIEMNLAQNLIEIFNQEAFVLKRNEAIIKVNENGFWHRHLSRPMFDRIF